MTRFRRLKSLRRYRMKKGRMREKGIYVLPNLCTTASLFFGFLSIVKALDGDFTKAAWLILVAGIFDLLDGRIARLTRTGSKFGAEYDSLVDLSSFGLAPGILMYVWCLRAFGKLGWLVAFLYFACGALRLARFNVQRDNVEYRFFQGLPIPMAAYALAAYVIFYHHLSSHLPEQFNLVGIFLTLSLALLMVSTVRYWSGKVFALSRLDSFFALVLLVVVIFIIALHPEICVFILVMGYVASGLFYEVLHRYPLILLYRKIRPEKDRPLPSAQKRSSIDTEHTTVQGG